MTGGTNIRITKIYMNETQYIVYWTMDNGQPASATHTDLNAALRHTELHRRQGMRFVTMCSESRDQVGKAGVAAVEDGKTPDGEDYTWSKAHRAGGTRGVPHSIIDNKSNK